MELRGEVSFWLERTLRSVWLDTTEDVEELVTEGGGCVVRAREERRGDIRVICFSRLAEHSGRSAKTVKISRDLVSCVTKLLGRGGMDFKSIVRARRAILSNACTGWGRTSLCDPKLDIRIMGVRERALIVRTSEEACVRVGRRKSSGNSSRVYLTELGLALGEGNATKDDQK
jgi:hypothetical protein